MYEDHIAFAEALFRKNAYPIDVVFIDISEASLRLNALQAEGARIIIARGGVVSIIRQNCKLPLISLEYNFLDFFEPVKKAYQLSDKVAIMGWYNSINNFDKYKTLLNPSIKFVEFAETTEVDCEAYIEKEVAEAARQGIEVVVGGGGVVRAARRLGVTAVHVDISAESYLHSAKEALYTLQTWEDIQRRYELIDSVLNCAFEGAVTIDPEGRITSCNNIARRIFNLPRQNGDEKIYLLDYFPHREVIEKGKAGQKLTNQFFTVNNTQIVLNTEPLTIDGNNAGSVFMIHETDMILNLEKNIVKNAVSSGHYAKYSFEDIVGKSYVMQRIKGKAAKYANSSSPVLICGESGTGKEIFAQSIHNAGDRKNYPFVAINCAALPESILESELFGYVKGAFTGARSEGRKGFFELAHKGTIFLDEIGDLSPTVQAKILRVLQEKEISRIGDDKVIPVDVRVITATNKDLWKAVEEGKFREDLYYRVGVLNLTLPPLRQHKEDIPELLACLNERAGFPEKTFSEEALRILGDRQWRGNIRELSNFLERLDVTTGGTTVTAADIYEVLEISENPGDQYKINAGNGIRKVDGGYILHVLKQNSGNKKNTAKALGISTSTLWRRLKELNP
jgi:transcriptional regulator with PAS, ATPase and Fis domain